ncbi:hypothetical protein Hypma_009488 [Hypsizygus marmoreus]|uniref:Uncharacterized protein n=1 Tax=Hypsizygus marmoreus TaxID=39966 RepID=A0A369JW13_HYPMA|nr:hypothetical protein Hypma_009488 [Hypsizygus marmoreus]
MNFPGFYLIENAAHGFVGNPNPHIANSKDSDAVSVIKVAPRDYPYFYITQESLGTFIIHSLAQEFTGVRSGYTKREIAVIHHNEIVAFPDNNEHPHRWKLIRDVADPTHFHILDVTTMAYWRLSSAKAGSKVDLYYPIPEFLQNVPRDDAATTIPPGIAWKLTPVLASGRYHIKNLVYGDINVGTKDSDGNTPVVAASSPALWRINVYMRPPIHGKAPYRPDETPYHPDGSTWNIFFIKPKAKSSATTSALKAAADSNDDSDSDDDEAGTEVGVADNKVVVPEVEVKAPCQWDPIWSAKEGAWRIVDMGPGESEYEWSLAHKYQDGASEQAHVHCTDDKNGCSLWELIRISD